MSFYSIGGPSGSGSGSSGITPTGNSSADTSTFISALAAAKENGTKLTLGPGTWNITSEAGLEWQTATDFCPIIEGSGPYSTVIVDGTGGGSPIRYTQSADYTYGLGGGLKNLTIKGGVGTANLFRATGIWNFKFENVIFSNCASGQACWIDTNWVSQSGDPQASSMLVWDQCRWVSCDGSNLIYVGNSGGTLGNLPYSTIRNCSMIYGEKAFYGGATGLIVEGCQFGYIDNWTLDIDQEYGRGGVVTIRGNGFEGGVNGDIRAAVYGMVVENNRFTGVYATGHYPQSNFSVIQAGTASRDSARVHIRNNFVSFGETKNAAAGSRIYTNFVAATNVSTLTMEQIQYPQVNSDTYVNWGHKELVYTSLTGLKKADSGMQVSGHKTYQSQELTDPETFTPNFFGGNLWHIYIGTEASPPGTPAYTIANPTNSLVNTSDPGLNSGYEVDLVIENRSGQALTNSNFTFGTQYTMKSVPNLANNQRAICTLLVSGRAITSSEEIWQKTEWVVHG
jgi:hypothetical protein